MAESIYIFLLIQVIINMIDVDSCWLYNYKSRATWQTNDYVFTQIFSYCL